MKSLTAPIIGDDQHDARILADLLEQVGDLAERGETSAAYALIDEHPQHAERLRRLMPTIEALTAYEEPNDVVCEGTFVAPGDGTNRTLGDFRIIRELGRGGMGVVYEAEQISLGRRIALKVLPFAAMLDKQQLSRFKNEARAAATLDHPNIVAIHSVGSERGVHYYAMQLIEGPSLAEIIAEMKTGSPPSPEESASTARLIKNVTAADTVKAALPTVRIKGSAAFSTIPSFDSSEYFRTIAQLGIQAAEALDYAHQNGVLHRDVKPGNLLLDDTAKLWITDFGLARIEADAGLTMTGDILGTLRYMSPEQALAKRVVVDHRSDVYSLGVTLYELLTLRPAYTGDDRQELLRQIAFDEPRKPRQINARIPQDLETIVLKAIEKNPVERYATAQELADDFRRYLDDQSIKARPPTLLNRTTKWSRRHRPLVASLAILVLLSAIASSISAVLLAEERNKTAAALEESEAQKRQLEIDSQLLERERQRAETNLQQARNAIDKMFTRVAKDLAGQPHMDRIRRQLLEDALKFYQGFLSQNQNNVAIRHETALTYMRVGGIYTELGKFAEALEHLEQSRAMLEELARQHPAEPQYRLELAEAHGSMCYLMLWFQRPNEYLANHRKALTLYEELQRQFPTNSEYARRVASGHRGVAMALFEAGQATKSIDEFKQSLVNYEKARRDFPDLSEDKSWVGGYHHWLGRSLQASGRLVEAEQEYRAAHDFRMQLLAEQPRDVGRKHNLAHTKSYLAVLLRGAERAETALELFEQAIALDEQCLDDFPDQAALIRRTATDYGEMSITLMALGRTDDAEAAMRRSVMLYERLDVDGTRPMYIRRNIAWGNYNLGLRFEATGQHEKSAELFRKAIDEFEQLAVEHPEVTKCKDNLAWLLATCPAVQFRDPARAVKLAKEALQLSPSSADLWELLGVAQYRAGDFATAIETLETALKFRDEAVYSWLFLAMAHWRAGDPAQARQWYDKSRAWLEKNRPTDEAGNRFRIEAEELMGVGQENHNDTQDTKKN